MANDSTTPGATASPTPDTGKTEVSAQAEREDSRAELDPFRHDLGGRDNG